jgi:hypothetical protein
LLAALPLLPALTGACSADINELDSCYRLSGAYCERASRCGAGLDAGDCKRALGDQCQNSKGLQVGSPDDCASDLEQGCSDSVPTSCAGLSHDMGCDQCGSRSPSADAVSACCALAPLSAVCGGC